MKKVLERRSHVFPLHYIPGSTSKQVRNTFQTLFFLISIQTAKALSDTNAQHAVWYSFKYIL